MSSLSLTRLVPGTASSLIVAGVLWGTGGLAGSLLVSYGDLHPVSVAAYRLLLGGLFAVVFLLATGALRLPRAAAVARRLAVAGALLAFFQASYFAAVALTSVSLATMVTIGSVPVFVAAAGVFVDRRRPDPATLTSVVAAVAGLVLLTWAPTTGTESSALVAGTALALLAGAGFATLTLVTKRQVDGLDSVHTAAFGCLIGGMLLLPVAVRFGIAVPMRADTFAIALYLGAVPTALAYVAYFRGLRAAHPVLAALSALLEPLTAAVLAAVLLDDRLGLLGWCGAAMLVGAVAMSHLNSRQGGDGCDATAGVPGRGSRTAGGHRRSGSRGGRR